MAFLKETEKTLRAYFIIAGAISTLWAFMSLGGPGKNVPVTTSGLVTLAIWFPPIARLVLGPAFVIAGVGLKRALENGAPRTLLLVKIAGAVVVAEVLLFTAAANTAALAANSAELTGEAVGRAIIPLLILWYIHSNLRRLADESRRAIVDTVARKFD